MKLNTPCRILLVQDELDTFSLVQLLLQHLGHFVVSVGSVEKALSQLSVNQFDVLISDIDLPGGSGWDLVRRARFRLGSSVSAIALTTRASVADINESKIAGFDIHLSKPTSITDLNACILRLAPRPMYPRAESMEKGDPFRRSRPSAARELGLATIAPRFYSAAS